MIYPITQLDSSYNPIEDRILLTIKMQHNRIYYNWITRRFLTLLLPVLHGHHPITHEMLFSPEPIQHSTPKIYQPVASHPPSYPLGKSPLLLTKIRFNELKTLSATFQMLPESNTGLELPFTPAILNLFLTTLKSSVIQSNWNLQVPKMYDILAPTQLQ